MMNRTILFCILTLCSILSTYAQDKKEKQRFAPPPTNRNFSIVGAFSWMSMAEISPAAYNMDLSAHYIKPSFALDVYYEKGLQDMFRGRILGEGTFPAIEIFTQRIELNLAITYRSKIGRKGSLFNRGSVYRGGTQYDLYSRGEGNAAVYKQIRFGGSDKIFTYLSTAFSSSPEINSSVNGTFHYPSKDIFTSFDNRCFHLGLSSTKVYKVDSPGRSAGTDRIGMRKLYADVLYSPSVSYRFYDDEGLGEFNGIIPDQVFQNLGFRLGIETNRLNVFSGYWAFEVGMMPGLRPFHSQTDEQFLIYTSLKFGLETGWPLFNSKYK